MTETKKELHILELRGQWNAAVRVFGNLMLKLKQRSCNKLKTILHGKVIFACNSCLDSQIQIPTLFGVFFFFCFQLCFLFHLSMHQSIPVSSLIIFRAECWPFLRSVIPWVGHLQILMQPGDWAFANHGGPGHPWALHTIMEPKYS